jgi:phage terminase small subunit
LVKQFQTAADVLQPTADLSAEEMTHFNRITSSREVDTWSPHDLSIATQLARTVRRFDELQTQLDGEGLTIVNERGNRMAHPLLSASMTMSGTIQALSRTLGLSASQRALTGDNQRQRNSAEAETKKVLKRAAEDDLLA